MLKPSKGLTKILFAAGGFLYEKVLKAVGIITAGIVGVITLSVLILMSSDNWYNYEDDYY